MQYNDIPRTDMKASVVTFGAWAIVGDNTWGKQDEKDALAAIRAALDCGINCFDTAEVYGAGLSEELLAKALPKNREDLVVASKVSSAHLAPAELVRSCEASLRRLRSDHIDLYQIHWPPADLDLDDSIATLQTLRDQGKIRAWGVSNFGADGMDACAKIEAPVTNQLNYSLLFRALEYELLPACRDHGVGVLCYSPLMQGLLTGKFAAADDVPEGRARTRLFSKDREQARHEEAGCEDLAFAAIDGIRDIAKRLGEPMARLALAWLIEQPGVTSVIAGARSPRQVEENAAAGDLRLDAATLAELAQITADVKDHLGSNPDMWQTESRTV